MPATRSPLGDPEEPEGLEDPDGPEDPEDPVLLQELPVVYTIFALLPPGPELVPELVEPPGPEVVPEFVPELVEPPGPAVVLEPELVILEAFTPFGFWQTPSALKV